MKISNLKTDLAKAEAGIWIGDIPDMGDLRLKVRPTNNPDFRRVYAKLVETTPRHAKRGGQIVDPKIKADLSARALADTVLVDWACLEGDDGEPLPYSAEVAKAMMLDPEMAAFRDAVAWAGGVAEEETLVGWEEKTKN